MIRWALLLAAMPMLVAAHPAANVQAGRRVSNLVVYGSDPCPQGSADEVVVCARQPESERYRIPKALRGRPTVAARDGSWAGTARMLDAAGRQNTPNSCSANGSWGQTGCWDKFMADARADRQAQAQAESQGQPR